MLPFRPNLVITANMYGPQPMGMDLPVLVTDAGARGLLNLMDSMLMEVRVITVVEFQCVK